MVRLFSLLLLVVLLAGLLLWAFWPKAPAPIEAPPLLGPSVAETAPSPSRPEDRAALEATELRGRPGAGETRRRGPKWPVLASDKIPRGGLEVSPIGPDMKVLSPDTLHLRLERVGAAFWSAPLGVPDAETGVWTFRNVPFGKVVVHVWGDHALHVEKEADVLAGKTEQVEVFLDRAGAVAYKALLPDDKEPETVRVRLLSARTRRPILAHFQTRRATTLTSDLRATEAVLGGEGLVFAVPAGHYILEGRSAEGDETTKEVDIEIGKTTEVELYFSY